MTAPDKSGLWRKAAVLGSLWAASEIVLGSFLHNARVPLRGHILTGLGIAILVAGHRLWPLRGLLWRSGLICAAMKSVSPSAIILGPMAAISMEGFLLEAGVLLGGANPAGYLLAGALAMSWALFHKVGGFFLYYGPDTWTLYQQGLERLRLWLGRPAINPWPPLLLVWAGHIASGFLAAFLGMRVRAHERASEPVHGPVGTLPGANAGLPPGKKPSADRPARLSAQQTTTLHGFSLTALALHLLFIVPAISLGQKVPVWVLAAAAFVYAAICVRAYQRARAIMRRMSLWVGIMAVSMAAGLLLGRWEAGCQMALRAIILTIGFSCVGSELRNPSIRSWLAAGTGRVFFEALEQAFNTLPAVFSAFPTGRQVVRAPVASLAAVMARAPDLLDDIEGCRVFIVTGTRGAGKSTLVADLAGALRRSGLTVGGIHAPGYWDAGRRSGFDVVDLATGETIPLCQAGEPSDRKSMEKFSFSPDGIAFGLRALADAMSRGVDVLMVDEVGPLELQGKGWASGLDSLAARRRKPMVWVVREGLLETVQRRWGLGTQNVLRPGEMSTETLLAKLRSSL